MFGNISIKEAHFLAQALGRPLTSEETAAVILAAESHEPLNHAIKLPVEADAAYTIRDERNRMGMTQVELARRIGLTQSQLAKIETGHAAISLVTLQRAMKVLGKTFVVGR